MTNSRKIINYVFSFFLFLMIFYKIILGRKSIYFNVTFVFVFVFYIISEVYFRYYTKKLK
jgi:hypothetical protein